jgi:hypothetical protein
MMDNSKDHIERAATDKARIARIGLTILHDLSVDDQKPSGGYYGIDKTGTRVEIPEQRPVAERVA